MEAEAPYTATVFLSLLIGWLPPYAKAIMFGGLASFGINARGITRETQPSGADNSS
jgi:hypothetical protein